MRLAPAVLAAASIAFLAACGSATPSPTSSSSGGGGSTPTATATPAVAPAVNESLEYTISTANIPGLGTVLVDGNGKTLYTLSSEKGDKVTCTSSAGCTGVWPDVELPTGVTAAIMGSGLQSSMLGTTTASDGSVRVTYGTYPLYTYSGDAAAGKATGQGLQSFGGTWYVIGADGNPITTGGGGNGGY